MKRPNIFRLNVKQSKVNESIDAKSWDWDLIAAVFKWPSEHFHHLVKKSFVDVVDKILKQVNI